MFSTDLDTGLTRDERTKETARRLAAFIDNMHAHAPRVPVLDGATTDSIDTSIALKNAYSFSQPNLSEVVVNFFLAQSFIGHQLAAMLAQHWLILKACYMPARDALRNGYQIRTVYGEELSSKKVLKYIEVLDKKFKVKKNCTHLIAKSRVFGIRIALFKVDSTDPDYYEKPFNIDGVLPNSYKGVVQIDPYWCSPQLDEAAAARPATMHFYEPTFWIIDGKKYHRSHLIILREGDVADILKPSYIYGGIPLPQRIVERVYAAERTANEAPQLAMTKRTTIYKTDVAQLIAAGPEAFERLDYAAQVQNNYGRAVIGLEDEMNQIDTSLTDLDEVIMSQYQLVAAIAEVPATKLLGTSPKGFGATGDYEIESYHESLESYQEDVTAFVERHHAILMRSHVQPRIQEIDPDFKIVETTINWNPLDTPTAKELSEINLNKSTAAFNYVNAGAVDGFDIRDQLINDKESGFVGIERAKRPEVVADEI